MVLLVENEILTAKEVAEYLKINERTIYKLAKNGQIPTIKIAHQWRFRKSMLDSWLDLQMSHPGSGNGNGAIHNARDISVPSMITRENIYPRLESSTKEEILVEMVELFCANHQVSDKSKFENAIIEREQLCSTALYEEVALPHPRYNGDHFVKDPSLIIGISRKGVEFGSFDGKPTHLFIMLCAPSAPQHLLMMAKICRLLTLPDLKEQLVRARSSNKILSLIQQQQDNGTI
jgi:nitrogen PTS system EIIA component